MTDAEAQALFQAFAAPLCRHARNAAARGSAERLARNLWLVMVLGPEMEQRLWEILKNTMKLPDEEIELLKQCYASEMRPLVNEEQRAALWQRYKVERKG